MGIVEWLSGQKSLAYAVRGVPGTWDECFDFSADYGPPRAAVLERLNVHQNHGLFPYNDSAFVPSSVFTIYWYIPQENEGYRYVKRRIEKKFGVMEGSHISREMLDAWNRELNGEIDRLVDLGVEVARVHKCFDENTPVTWMDAVE